MGLLEGKKLLVTGVHRATFLTEFLLLPYFQ